MNDKSLVDYNLADIPVVYINLDSDTKKNKKMLKLLKDNGFFDYTRISATKAIWDGIGPKWQNPEYSKACVNSFVNALSHIEAPFLLLEDDVLINEKVTSLAISIPKNADVVYLGGSNHGIENIDSNIPRPGGALFNKTKYSHIIVPIGMVTMHSLLIVTEKAKTKITNFLRNNDTIIQDVLCAKLQIANALNFYAYSPPMFFQEGEEYTKDPYPNFLLGES